ncbi:ATP-dependent DNA helicase UvrD/PcrA [Vibrio chagasii]|nr:ATP-dependent DNA helicase UvrD/PcrA [Vibrio chagasii]
MNTLESLVADLNSKQEAAVRSVNSRLLVLAGAGSGKTRVLVHRIARHINVDGFDSSEILALTFTNKAAREMAKRAAKLVGLDAGRNLFAGTFHSFCARFLFKNYGLAGLDKNIEIMDTADQRSLMGQIILGWEDEELQKVRAAAKAGAISSDEKDERIDGLKEVFGESRKLIRPILEVIDDLKNNMLGVNQAYDAFCNAPKVGGGAAEFALKLYKAYEEHKSFHSQLDFNDLILKTISVLQKDEDLRSGVQARFKAVLVDEYQDTNTAQDTLFCLLISPQTMVTVVGDEDQLIYGWRGAQIHNILEFDKRHRSATVVLDQNYRSTSNILSAANHVIKNNKERKGKTLWTAASDGDLLNLNRFHSSFDEARFVSGEVSKLLNAGVEPNEIALLYRTNSISSLLERFLTQERIKHILYGSVGFWGRVETKHVLSYLKWICNENSQLAMKSALSKAKVGYGDKTHIKLSKLAKEAGVPLEVAVIDYAKAGKVTANKRKLQDVVEFVQSAREEFAENGLWAVVQMVVDKSGIKDYYKSTEKDHDVYLERYENIMGVVDLAKMFVNDSLEDGELQQNDLEAFITSADLQVKVNEDKDVKNSISLMTLHASKGLEFPYVFIVGADEGVFPSKRSIEKNDLEEERRLMYVGLTRGMKKVYVTTCGERITGATLGLSQFIREIPKSLLRDVKPQSRFRF